jgi:hypothetical protein
MAAFVFACLRQRSPRSEKPRRATPADAWHDP